MLRRLLLTYLSLLTCLLLALEVPLAVGFARDASQEMFINRLGDAGRFASIADAALDSGSTASLTAEIGRYDELYGRAVVVVDLEGRVIAASRPDVSPESPRLAERIDAALLGLPTERTEVFWPWRTEPLVLAEPVGRDSQVVGAVAVVSPTGAARSAVLRRWLLLALAGVVALAAAWLAAVPVARWILRPVRNLDDATHEIAAGHLAARVSDHAGPIELRRLARSFNAMAQTVTASLDRQRAFATDASHQLLNPITALRLRVENLAPYLTSSAEGSDEHRLALAESERLSHLVEDLLRLARAEVTQADTVPVAVDDVVAARLAAWRRPAAATGVALVRESLSGPGPLEPGSDRIVRTMPGVLEQVLDALLDNAVKFAHGTRVAVRVGHRDGHVEIHVADDGPGLSDADRVRATERFWRSRAHQKVPGTGLGLAIVAVLVEASGGTLDLLPVEPHGLDVRLRLPTSAVGAAAQPAPAAPVSGSPRGSTARHPGAAAPGTSRSPTAG